MAVTGWAVLGQAPASQAAVVATRSPAGVRLEAAAVPVAQIVGPRAAVADVVRRAEPPTTMTEAFLQSHMRLERMLAGEYLTGYIWPLRHARITNAFGWGQPGSFVVDGDTIHDGIDLSTFCGDRIVAAHDGVVIAKGRRNLGAMGWLGDLAAYHARLDAAGAGAIAVVINDGNGFHSVYLHLGRAIVDRGDVVEAGQLIGYEGSTGHSTGCHLHYALFSPAETRTYRLHSRFQARAGVLIREIARIDPLLAMPPLSDAGITWGWGAKARD